MLMHCRAIALKKTNKRATCFIKIRTPVYFVKKSILLLKSSNFICTEHENSQYNIKKTKQFPVYKKVVHTQSLKYSKHECRVSR